MKKYLVIFVLLLVTLQGCKSNEAPPTGPPPVNPPTTKIPVTTKIISTNNFNNFLNSISNDSTQFTFKSNFQSTYNPKINDIIYLPTNTGLLRKITSIDTSNNNVTISTTQGTLTEAIEYGRLSYRASLKKSQIKKIEFKTKGIKLVDVLNKVNDTKFNFDIDKVVYDADGNEKTTNDQVKLTGNFELTTDIIFNLGISGFSLDSVSYGFVTNNKENLKLTANSNYNIKKEIEFGRVTFNPIYLQIGPLPVVITPVLLVNIGIDGYTNSSLETSMSNDFYFDAEIRYKKQTGWTPYANSTNTFTFNPPIITANAGARGYVAPEFDLAVYGILAGYTRGEGYGEILADITQTPWWNLYIGFNLTLGVKAKILGKTIFDYSKDDLIAFRKKIAEAQTNPNVAPDNPSNPSPSNNAIDQNTSLTLSWDGTDPDGDPLTYDIYFGTNSPPTNKVSTSQTTKSFSVGNLSNSTPYFWKIVAKDDHSNITIGPIWKFTTVGGGTIPSPPTLIAPSNNSINVSLTPTLMWNSSDGATGYGLLISTDANFMSYYASYITTNSSGVLSTTLDGLSSSIPFNSLTKYYWKMTAGNNNGHSEYSQIWNFTTGNGNSNPITTKNLWAISFGNQNNGIVVGEKGTIIKTTNGGATWVLQTSGTTASFYGVSFSDANNGLIVGSGGKIFRTTNGGTTWDEQVSGITNNLISVSFIDAKYGTAVGVGGIIIRTTDGGVTWTKQTSGTTKWLNNVYFNDANNGTIVGIGALLKTTNGGAIWSSYSIGASEYLMSVSFSDLNNGTIVGYNGRILRTTNGGTSWTQQVSGTSLKLFSVYFTDANNGTAVGENGTILRTNDGGTNWASQASNTNEWLLAVYFNNQNNGNAVGYNGKILRTTNGGITWSTQ